MPNAQPATFDTVQHMHRMLGGDLRKLATAIDAGSDTAIDDLRAVLSATYTHLCEHFRFEEQDGFMDELRERDPRLERSAEELLDEHRTLRQSLDALHGEAIVASRLDHRLRERIAEWIARVRRHEVRENDLMQDAVDADFGAMD